MDKLTIYKVIGKTKYPITVEGENWHELVMKSKKYSFDDMPKCGLCNSDELYPNARRAQGKFDYTEIRCKKCNGSLTFGHKMEDKDVVYYRRKKDTKGNSTSEFAWTKFDEQKDDND